MNVLWLSSSYKAQLGWRDACHGNVGQQVIIETQGICRSVATHETCKKYFSHTHNTHTRWFYSPGTMFHMSHLLLVLLKVTCTVPISHRSVDEFGHPTFPPSATVLAIKNIEDPFDISQTCPLIDSYDPHGIPCKLDLMSFSSLNPYPSNCCHKWTIVVHLLAFWVHLLQVVQAKKGTCFDVQMAAGVLAASTTARRTKGFLLWRHVHPFPNAPCINVQKRDLYEIFKNFYGAILGSRTAM